METELFQPTEMNEAIYQDLTPEERLEKLRNTADQIVNHSWTRPYSEERIAEICVQIDDYERELACIKSQYKGLITPLENSRADLVADIRSGGEYVTEECFVFLNFNIGKAGLYTKEGELLNCKVITPEMSQSTIFSMLRDEEPEEQENVEPEDEAPEGNLLPAHEDE